MRYTRYDLKRKKRNNGVLILIFALIIISAILIGTAMSKVIFRYGKGSYNNAVSNNNSSVVYKYTFFQCGLFSKKENADALVKSLENVAKMVEVPDNGKIRVITGIYKNGSNSYNAMVKTFKNNSTSYKNIDYTFKSDKCNDEIAAIINANLQIIDRSSQSGVENVKTKSLKKWTSNLEKIDSTYKNSKNLNDLKAYIGKMANTYNGNNIDDNITFLFNELKKVKE
ncbi:MAG: SPOR domain-containing protein [Clostridium sp.]|nr:SPOR domain-containing protein [Clostridium sp.]